MSNQEAVSEFLSSLDVPGNNLFPYLANMRGVFSPGKDTVYYSGPYWDQQEIATAIESLISGHWLSSGEKVNRFETLFSRKFNFSDSVMVNSGSSANLVMIAALKKHFGWQDGDEIIVSVVGFPTTVSAILQNNLKPVFVDITWEDLNWDLKEIESKITARTKAVFSSPVLGNPYDLDELIRICESKDVQIISDNCDSLGSKWKNQDLTEYSVAASCSFYPAHHITTMEGGMVSSKTEEIVTLARSFAWWGRACYCVGRQNLLSNGTCKKRFSNWIDNCDVVVDHKYVFENVGYNLKPLDLQGAIGIIQLDKFDEIHSKRRENKKLIDEIFSEVSGVRVISELPNAETSWFGAPIVCDSDNLKRKLVQHLEDNKVQTRNYFAGNLLMQPGYQHLGDWKDYPIATQVLGRVFFLGVSPTISREMMDYVREVVAKFVP